MLVAEKSTNQIPASISHLLLRRDLPQDTNAKAVNNMSGSRKSSLKTAIPARKVLPFQAKGHYAHDEEAHDGDSHDSTTEEEEESDEILGDTDTTTNGEHAPPTARQSSIMFLLSKISNSGMLAKVFNSGIFQNTYCKLASIVEDRSLSIPHALMIMAVSCFLTVLVFQFLQASGMVS